MKKVLALEGEWSSRLDSTLSIKSALQFLKETEGVEYIYRHCVTIDALKYYLERIKTYSSYSIIYMAFHGNKSFIELEKGAQLTLKELAELSRGAFENKYVHFGSCQVAFDIDDLLLFKTQTGAINVSGFQKDVLFLDGTFIDMALFSRLQQHDYHNGLKELPVQYAGLVDKTGFVIV